MEETAFGDQPAGTDRGEATAASDGVGGHTAAAPEGGATATGQWLLRSFLRPCVLLLTDEQPAYGYELQQRLAAVGLGNWEHGTIYRVLNIMEDEGLVSSDWQRSERGPRRRRYRVTDAGRRHLAEWSRDLSRVCTVLATFLDRYERDADAHVHVLGRAARRARSGDLRADVRASVSPSVGAGARAGAGRAPNGDLHADVRASPSVGAGAAAGAGGDDEGGWADLSARVGPSGPQHGRGERRG